LYRERRVLSGRLLVYEVALDTPGIPTVEIPPFGISCFGFLAADGIRTGKTDRFGCRR
jgi:hypothetical protein